MDTAAAVTFTQAATVDLDVNANANNDDGDGGGLYYRVVYVYMDEDGEDVEVASDMIKLGDVTTDPTSGATGLIGPAAPASGETLRVDSGTDTVEVQWEMQNAMGVWMDLADETGLELSLADDHAGRMVRANVTYKGDEDGPVIPPDDGGAFIDDDLLDSFVLAIDDIDVA